MSRRVLWPAAALVLIVAVWLVSQSGTGTSQNGYQLEPANAAATGYQLWQLAAPADPSPSSRLIHSAENLRQTLDIPVVLPTALERIELPLPDGRIFSAPVSRSEAHPNGDVSWLARNSEFESALLTIGSAGVFARLRSNGRTYQVTTDREGSWILDLSQAELDVDHFGNDVLTAGAHDRLAKPSQAWLPPNTPDSHRPAGMARIDVMFVATPDLSARYPGDLLATRFNHFVAIANQAMIDSRVDAQVRMVHYLRSNYQRHQNNELALPDLRAAAAGQNIPGLTGLATTRSRHGADIVALIRTHDIETRGNCGIAYYPQINSNGQASTEFGVHITNDGTSNWSVCSDAVFTHELGHNLGAQHQRDTIASPDPQASNFAWAVPGRWHTVMGSFATGHVDRYRRLDLFSNPVVQCGGQPCGSSRPSERADNASTLNQLAPIVAAYMGEAGRTDTHPDPSNGDQDGDGIPDRDDPWPFDPHNGEPPPETRPDLVFSERRLKQPESAAQWELLVVSSGNDRVLSWGLDGRYRGIVVAPQAVDAGPVLTEYSDLLADSSGRLYLLASEDVRRFDRLSGRLIDVFLDSALPEPRSLQSPFPRAMGWLDGGRLAVLGDTAIEVYSQSGVHLNPLRNNPLGADPPSWIYEFNVPLRALAVHDKILFVAENAQQRIMRFSAQHGQRNSDLLDADTTPLSDPRDMAIGPDGLLYVANGSANNVWRFAPEPGGLAEEFIPAGLGGLDFARALAFGPDGELYVASRNSHAVLVFHSEGQPMGTLTTSGDNALRFPENLLLVPVLDEISPGHSGQYFVPERSGEGWLLEILDEQQATLSWFTFPPADQSGAVQAWVVGVGQIKGSSIVFDELLATHLIDPSAPIEFDNIAMQPWGRMVLDFSSCEHGRASFESPLFEADGVLDFVRLSDISGLPCGSVPQPPRTAAPGISGQWNDPDSSGQGWFLQELGDGRVLTAWFSYADNGEQLWLVGDGRLEGNHLIFDELFQPAGTRFGADFDPEAIDYPIRGSLEFEFIDCAQATASYDITLPSFGQNTLYPERLTWLAGLECSLEGAAQ